MEKQSQKEVIGRFFLSVLLSLCTHCGSEPLSAISYVFFYRFLHSNTVFQEKRHLSLSRQQQPVILWKAQLRDESNILPEQSCYLSRLFILSVSGPVAVTQQTFTDRSIIVRVGLILLLLFFLFYSL